MTYYSMLHQALHDVANSPDTAAGRLFALETGALPAALGDLIASIPSSQDWAFARTFRGVVRGMIELATPDAPIRMLTRSVPPFGAWTDTPDEPERTFRQVFLGNVDGDISPIIRTMRRKMFQRIPRTLLFLQDYATALLIDAIYQCVPSLRGHINAAKLQGDLARYHTELAPTLSTTYQVFIQYAYGPTATAIAALRSNGLAAGACNALKLALLDDRFVALLSQAPPGDDAALAQAEWLLFNLWVLLSALDDSRVDEFIRQLGGCGVAIPAAIGSDRWSSTYVRWFAPLTGFDLAPSMWTVIGADMPVKRTLRLGSKRYERLFKQSFGYARALLAWSPYGTSLPRLINQLMNKY